jgi:DNA-binding NtrC family response regulator
VIPVQLPPLRERKEDVPLLVQHFLGKFQQERNAGGDGEAPGDRARTSATEVQRRRPCRRKGCVG